MRLQKLFGPSNVAGLLISEAMLIFTCYSLAAVFVVSSDPLMFLLHQGGLTRIALLAAAIMAGLYFQDLYSDLRVLSKTLLIQQVSFCIGLAFLLQAGLNYVDSSLVFPRWLMLLGSTFAIALLPGWRTLYCELISTALHAVRILFLGASPLAYEIDRHIAAKPQLGLTGIGFVGEPGGEEGAPPPDRILGSAGEFRSIVERFQPDRIVVAMSEQRGDLPQNDLLDLRFAGREIQDASTAYEIAFERVCLRALSPAHLIFSGDLGPQPRLVFLQGCYSWAVAAAGLILSLPIVLLAAVLIKLSSPGPVLFTQRRVGLRGVPFTLYKFRSMWNDAENSTGAVWAQRDDPRVTPVGRWLRRFRIDEIPQLLNVLKGEMSIVGPRPERPEFVESLTEKIPYYGHRHSVKPGITGWAQINHKYGDTIEDTITKLEYDLYYIKNWSPALDAGIMFHTARVVLLGRGAQ